MILKQANRMCIRLWRDESGVVLALTMVVFLTLFVIACSVFAVGEIIRQKIELQNAADAAAYSAAVIQADAVSRMAALNLAMGWTYVETVRREMDYIVDKWLERTVEKFDDDLGHTQDRNVKGDCRRRKPYYWTGVSERQHGVVSLNGTSVSIATVRNQRASAAAAGKSWRALGPLIDRGNRDIGRMNDMEDQIRNDLQNRIESTVKGMLRHNVTGADVRFSCLHLALDCFGHPASERYFLRMLYHRSVDPKEDVFGPGTDDWFVRKPGDGFGREYQQKSRLESTWNWYWSKWISTEDGCKPIDEDNGGSWVKGDLSWRNSSGSGGAEMDARYGTEMCKPWALTRDYFAKAGAIVVGVARPQRNPFNMLFSSKKPQGIYSAFSATRGADGKESHMWAVSAARAGYRDSDRPAGAGGDRGAYNPTVDSYVIQADQAVPAFKAKQIWIANNGWQGGGANASRYNLSVLDWDAVLLPISRVWSERRPAWQNRPDADKNWHNAPEAGRWQKATGGEVLDELWSSAAWRSLQGGQPTVHGLASVAYGGPPPGMDKTIAFGSVSAEVLH